MKKGISVVIPSYNREDILRHCLGSYYKALEYCGLPYEIIVVDDGSTVPYSIKDVRLIRNQKRMGVSRSNNLAYKTAKYSYVFMCDDDMILNLDVFDKLTSTYLWDDKRTGAIGTCVPTYKTVNYLPYINNNALILTSDGFVVDLTSSIVPVDRYIETDILRGGSIIRSDVLKEIGYWDTNFKSGYCADTDLFLKIRYREYKLYYNPSIIIQHLNYEEGGCEVYDIFDRIQDQKYFINKWRKVKFLARYDIRTICEQDELIGKLLDNQQTNPSYMFATYSLE